MFAFRVPAVGPSVLPRGTSASLGSLRSPLLVKIFCYLSNIFHVGAELSCQIALQYFVVKQRSPIDIPAISYRCICWTSVFLSARPHSHHTSIFIFSARLLQRRFQRNATLPASRMWAEPQPGHDKEKELFHTGIPNPRRNLDFSGGSHTLSHKKSADTIMAQRLTRQIGRRLSIPSC